jgi:hypothetical protein
MRFLELEGDARAGHGSLDAVFHNGGALWWTSMAGTCSNTIP